MAARGHSSGSTAKTAKNMKKKSLESTKKGPAVATAVSFEDSFTAVKDVFSAKTGDKYENAGKGSEVSERGAEESLIAYVHELSPIKKNRRQTMEYSTLVLQTEKKSVQALLYANKKRPILADSARSHTPIKIQRFTKTADGEKVIINKMTKVGIAQQGDYSFQFEELDNSLKISSIKEILESREEWENVSMCGKAVHVGEMSVVGAKKLKLVQCTFADTTGSIQVDIWQDHIPLVESGKVYTMGNLHVRVWSGIKKVSTRIESVITAMIDEDIQKVSIQKEDIQTNFLQTITVSEIAFVQNIESSMCCTKCSRKVLQSTNSKIVHCDRCGCTMRIGDCKTQVCAKVEVHPSPGEQINLTIFQGNLQTVIERDVAHLSEEEISMSLLYFENLEITYNTKTFVVTKLLLKKE